MNPIACIQKYKNDVDHAIDTVFKRQMQENTSGASRVALTKLHRFVKRGKHIRSGIFLISLEMFGVAPINIHFDIAAALEIMHSAFLIHDDIMDNDEMRRGEPSIHASYKTPTKFVLQASNEYANAMGLGSGDIAIFMAYKMLLESTKNLSNREDLLLYGINEYLRVGFAQLEDVENSYSTNEPTPNEIRQLYVQKTARYTFSLPLVFGAYVARVPNSMINTLNELGEHIGLLYQLRDDEIGLFNSSDITGKPVGSDFRENKKTMMHASLMNVCNKQESAFIQSLKHKETLTSGDINQIQELLKKYSIKDKLTVMKNESKKKGLEIIQCLPIDQQYSDFLHKLIDYIEKRDK